MTELAQVIQADRQVKSKKRVADHGEVFTSEREVNAMLDLVKDETERIDSRFLEPACGTGNFLVEVLRRKLTVVTSWYASRQAQWERYAAQAVSSIYGVDILEDNVEECRERLFQLVDTQYKQLFSDRCSNACRATYRFILSRNILWGDALNLKTPDEKAEPIIFSEWGFATGNMVKRRDYTMDKLLKNQPMEGPNLFSDMGDQAFIPTPIEDYPLTHFLNLADDALNELQPGRTDLSGQSE
ncbi:SAM-dependent DNA methyltransferase [Fibrella sp. HMF5335]|uniref:SAM-dependent DNA methyltransferase n=1 Tax=Fibrella rubiginis TaxID=2817060 RepID=A0A939GES8_9BACT|nr:SAM-dependent DNA methyltransferase [Fibrella rubiginis]MBO0935391.1 SAM-dependent DNA methyltransferase [Fibrella rubiginis]